VFRSGRPCGWLQRGWGRTGGQPRRSCRDRPPQRISPARVRDLLRPSLLLARQKSFAPLHAIPAWFLRPFMHLHR